MGAAGPCLLTLNVGGKMFKTHYDELEKGVISGATMMNPMMKKGKTGNFTKKTTKDFKNAAGKK